MREKGEIILWPVYFDSLRNRREGRRLPKKLCVPSPNIDMLEKALKSLGLDYKIYPEAAHPRLPWVKTGFIAVKKGKKRKNQILKKVAIELKRLTM